MTSSTFVIERANVAMRIVVSVISMALVNCRRRFRFVTIVSDRLIVLFMLLRKEVTSIPRKINQQLKK